MHWISADLFRATVTWSVLSKQFENHYVEWPWKENNVKIQSKSSHLKAGP